MVAIAVIPYPFLVISIELANIFKAVRTPSVHFCPLNIFKRDKKIPYYLFYSHDFFTHYIAVRESEIYRTKSVVFLEKYGEKITTLYTPEDLGYLTDMTTSPFMIRIKKLVLDSGKIKHDIFRLPKCGPAKYIVSEKIVELVRQKGLRGINFTAVESI
ncbi:MAG: hypothetical protein JNL02_20525 [Saprospiraceae bacterium]|nr:hypothetical protein [Saprospiraceae bacterium]